MTLPSVDWLDGEARRLVAFARASVHPAGGFAFLDDRGEPELDRPVETWLTARMTHVFAIGHLLGEPDCAPLVDYGVTALFGRLHDAADGGWHSGVDAANTPTVDRKEAYQHAFVVLAAASAVQADHPRGDELLRLALDALDMHFWEADRGAHQESFAGDWSDAEAYRGANSNMHAVEALLAAADAVPDAQLRERALLIAERIVNDAARGFGWRLVEHFDAQWEPVPTYNADNKTDQFRPYGLTIGHWLEWSRLLLNLEAALANPPEWLAESAVALFANAMRLGWSVDGNEGFVYTIGWDDEPVVRARMHWVVAEGIGAAAALHRRTGEASYEEILTVLWSFAQRHLIDLANGSWHHELDEANAVAATVWAGKPDVYHALQATLLPRLPLAPSLVAALRAGLLDSVPAATE